MHPDTPLSLATIAYSRHAASAANARADVVTCGGCKAGEQGGDWGKRNCDEMCQSGVCQRLVYLRITMARLVVELVRVMAEAGYSEAMVRDVLEVGEG